jgi:cytidine deaminase
MALLSLFQIQKAREKHTQNPEQPAHGVAYIIRQLKRPEEISLFRELYGKQVFQISAYADPEQRKGRLAAKMRDYDSAKTRISEFEGAALNLVNRDEHEDAVSNGQRLRDVFPLADVFIDATTSDSIRKTIQRFLRVVFGYNFHSPTREEYGMYIAKSASLRSSDLSRQVGAAVFSAEGEVKVLGCNEVPSPSGGTYWEDDQGDSREFKVGLDTNEEFKHRLLSDVIKNFVRAGIMDKRFSMMPTRRFLAVAKRVGKFDLEKQLLMMDLIEYGRIIHAEMNAITDAARKGISLKDGILYCTTFPCHLCAKHIISSGIKKVIYIEPYPKSYAQELYRDEIYLGRTQHQSPERVHFEPFIGIAPFRFRDFFQKGKRKSPSGKAKEWENGEPRPILEIKAEVYPEVETQYLKALVQQFAEKRVGLPDSVVTHNKDKKAAP